MFLTIPSPRALAVATLSLALLARCGSAAASCDVIPGANPTFGSSMGVAARPFAAPNQPMEVSLRACDPTTAPFTGSNGFTASADAYVVTVLFTPPSATAHAVVLTAGSCATLQVESCLTASPTTSICCLEGADANVNVVTRSQGNNLSFRFPNTDRLVREPSDGRSLAGPALIAVTRVGSPLPGLTATTCAAVPGPLACIDAFFVEGGSCAPSAVAGTFPHFTALPSFNDYQALCDTPNPPCTGTQDELRFAVDSAGNILMPMDWQGVQVNRDRIPIPRLLRATTLVEAFAATGQAIQIPDPGALGLPPDDPFLASYALNGRKLQPIFDPQRDPTVVDAVTLFGSADAPATILRIARRSPSALLCLGGPNAGQPCGDATACPDGSCGVRVCVGGGNAGTPCVADDACAGGVCRDGLFDFSDRVLDGVGPVVVHDGACLGGSNELGTCVAPADCPAGQCAAFSAAALDPVPLDGLAQSADVNAFVASEAIQDQDLNGDGDATDDVIRITDRATGLTQALGSPASCGPRTNAVGRAAVRTPDGPFTLPALTVEDDVVAFLESGEREGCGDPSTAALRVFRLGGGELTPSDLPFQLADPAPVIDGRTLVVSRGRVFYRESELDHAERSATRLRVETADGLLTSYPSPSSRPAFSADGGVVAFVAGLARYPSYRSDIYAHDFATDVTELVSEPEEGGVADGSSQTPTLSADGRYLCFESTATNLLAGDPGPGSFVRDRLAQTTLRLDGVSSPCRPAVRLESTDGRFVAFSSTESNLFPGDFNSGPDVFVGDVLRDSIERVGGSSDPAMSADGRFVTFGFFEVALRDRLLGTTRSVATAGFGGSALATISDDGTTIAYLSFAGTPSDPNFGIYRYQTVVSRPASVAAADALFPNGHADDRVLEVLDTTASSPSPTILCPATAVAVADGNAAFLRPESAVGTATCPGGSLNAADADTDDQVVQLWRGGAVEDLGRAATAVALSSRFLAALVSEAADGGTPYNGDGDTSDTVVQLHDVTGGDWRNLGHAADTVDVRGSIVAFVTPEAAEGRGSLNADDDSADRVLQVYDAATDTLLLGAAATSRTRAVEDFVMGGEPGREIVAFRTHEESEHADLNHDGDLADDVLEIYDVANRRLIDTGATLTPCRLEACDPRFPYRVGRDVVTFLTFECDQGDGAEALCPGARGADLDRNGRAHDLVLQTFNVRRGLLNASLALRTARGAAGATDDARNVVAAVGTGICTNSGRACSSNRDCDGGKCFVPPGGCVKERLKSCDPTKQASVARPLCERPDNSSCCPDEFCDPIPGSSAQGTCKIVVGPCDARSRCDKTPSCSGANPPCVCTDAGANVKRILSPLANPDDHGNVLTSAGRCVEDIGVACTSETACPSPTACDDDGRCIRRSDTCRTVADCPPGSLCLPELVVATDVDTDGDGVPDRLDVCPIIDDSDQADRDRDGVGDACETASRCGDGVRDPSEECDDGNQLAGDGCSNVCELGCPAAPAPDCRHPFVGRKSTLALRSGGSRTLTSRLRWEWRGGAATTRAELGDPLRRDAYALCVYDAAGLRSASRVPAGGSCGRRPCWKARSNGFRYANRRLLPDGISQIELHAGKNGKAEIRMLGRGPQLVLPPSLAFASPVTVQLRSSTGRCWDARFQSPFAVARRTSFRARAD